MNSAQLLRMALYVRNVLLLLRVVCCMILKMFCQHWTNDACTRGAGRHAPQELERRAKPDHRAEGAETEGGARSDPRRPRSRGTGRPPRRPRRGRANKNGQENTDHGGGGTPPRTGQRNPHLPYLDTIAIVQGGCVLENHLISGFPFSVHTQFIIWRLQKNSLSGIIGL